MRSVDRNEKYLQTILSSEFPDEVKVNYLRNLYTIQKLSPEQMEDLEERIYDVGKKILSDKERITYEANFLYSYYKENDLELTDIRKLYYKIKRATSNPKELNTIKMLITQLQLINGLNIRFYNAYLELLEKMHEEKERENTVKCRRTFHK